MMIELLNDLIAYAQEHHGQDLSGIVRAYIHKRRLEERAQEDELELIDEDPE